MIFLSRFDPEADFHGLSVWAEELATRKEPPGEWRVWDVLRFLGEKAWTCPRATQRLVEEAQGKDIIGRISLAQLGRLLRTRPESATISFPPISQLAEDAIHFATGSGNLECVEAFSTLPELRR
jgi:hypothetical protein